MALIPSFPEGLHDPRDVGIFNEELKSIWHQERALLNHPLANFREYSFSGIGAPPNLTGVAKTLITEYLDVEISVPDLDLEVIANSGGLILPTDRFLSAYDVNPSILAVVEWPAGSGYLFTFKRKEYNPVSGRLETLIRQDNHLKGVIYRRVKDQTFDGPNWKVEEDTEDFVLTVNRDELNFEEQLLFAGKAAAGDIVFWAMKSGFVLPSTATAFVPSIRDIVVDFDDQGAEEVYRIIGTRFDPREDFYRILARRYEET